MAVLECAMTTNNACIQHPYVINCSVIRYTAPAPTRWGGFIGRGGAL